MQKFLYKNRVIRTATKALKQVSDIQHNTHIPSSLCAFTQQSELGMCALRCISETCFSAFCGSPNYPALYRNFLHYLLLAALPRFPYMRGT